MRVLMLTDFYHPVVGGLERHVQLLAETLHTTGHHTEVATLQVPGAHPNEVINGVRIHRLTGWSWLLRRSYVDPMRPFHPPFTDPGISRQLRRLIQQLQPDVIHAHSWILYSQLANTTGPPLVVTLHDYGLICPRKDYLHHGSVCSGPQYRKCLPCATDQYGALKALALTTGHALAAHRHHRVARYLAVSQAVADAVVPALGRSAPPVEVIPPFILDDLPVRAQAAKRPAFLPAGDYLLYVGALARHKGLPVLLEAYSRLRHPLPLVLIGTQPGPAHDGLPEGVITVAGVAHEQVLAAFRDCAIAVAPSVWQEPMPLVAMEAGACGAPMIASDIGGLRDIVAHGQTGLLVPPGDPVALADALDRLLADGCLRGRMGTAGRERSQDFRAAAVVPRIMHAYQSAAGQACGRLASGERAG